ncbi:MAG TPA: hypothetical protein VJQ54_04595, partial [Candidatus Sulfotelmatobacter sp.]|nr:hypothetical protein [Candidatus Sulfotelmatobacter sp.]
MVKPRAHRIHMYLSEEELQTIEDWRYANRIATRSDAIRRLCHIGLAAEENARQIGKVAAAAMMWASKTRKLQSEELV